MPASWLGKEGNVHRGFFKARKLKGFSGWGEEAALSSGHRKKAREKRERGQAWDGTAREKPDYLAGGGKGGKSRFKLGTNRSIQTQKKKRHARGWL